MSYMKLKQFALVMSLVLLGTQCASACITREEAQQQSLTEKQQKVLVAYVSQLFNNTKRTDINWYCFAGAIAQFINEHKNIADKPLVNKRFKDLADVLNSTSGVSPYIPYIELGVGVQLQNYKDLFANDPAAIQRTNEEILALLKSRINYKSNDTCKDNLVDDLYEVAYPTLCDQTEEESEYEL